MSPEIALSPPLSPANVTTLEADIAAIEVLLTGYVPNLTSIQTNSMIKVAANREAEIKDVHDHLYGMTAPSIIPTNFDVAGYDAALIEKPIVDHLISLFQDVINKLKVREEVLEHNLFVQTIELLDSAKLIGKKVKTVGDVAALIATTYNDVQGNKKVAAEFSLKAGNDVTISHVVTNRTFLNHSNAILTFNIVGGPIAGIITVNPQSRHIVPKHWTNLLVTNLSPTEDAKFSVFIK